MKACLLILCFITLLSCHQRHEPVREAIDVSGTWQFAMDTADVGIRQQWFLSDLEETDTLIYRRHHTMGKS